MSLQNLTCSSRRVVLAGVGAAFMAALTPIRAVAGPGRVVLMPKLASNFVGSRDVMVWLPQGYEGGGRHAVLYMHDGQNLMDPSKAFGGEAWGVDVTLQRLIDTGSVRRTIVVGVSNTPKRSQEYVPEKVFAALPEPLRQRLAAVGRGDPLSDQYLRFLVEELKPMIDRRFRTRPGRSQTFIAGSSMGGLISLYALLEYPQVFGGAACISTHWALPVFAPSDRDPALDRAETLAAFEAYLAPRLPAPGRCRIWFDHGTETLDANYAPYQERIDALFAGHGLRRGRDWESRVYSGAAHNEASWRARLADPLRFLLAPRA